MAATYSIQLDLNTNDGKSRFSVSNANEEATYAQCVAFASALQGKTIFTKTYTGGLASAYLVEKTTTQILPSS